MTPRDLPPAQSHALCFALAGSGALSLPALGPDHGLIAFATTAFCAFVLMRLASLGQGGGVSRSAGARPGDDVVLLARDGRLQLEPLDAGLITRDEIFEILRRRGVVHLGQVARLYREPNGAFALVKQPDPTPGLSILPRAERPHHAHRDLLACTGCGRLLRASGETTPCDGCHGTEREEAVS